MKFKVSNTSLTFTADSSEPVAFYFYATDQGLGYNYQGNKRYFLPS